MNTEVKIKWAFLCSGYGNSAQACLDLQEAGRLGQHQIAALVTDGQQTPLEARCREMGITVFNTSARAFPSIEAYQQDLIGKLQALEVDYVFMLAYKYRIRDAMLQAFPNRILNVHPSLLPAFRNTSKAIQEALDMGVRVSGITTHIIDAEIDRGVILCQEPIRLEPGDTVESVYPRFLQTGKKILCDTFREVANHHIPGRFLQALAEKSGLLALLLAA
ncbi:formyltransferase family protein [Robiginitalea sp. M366]|uniref:phosphoribosylglycinamide formyltransferase n=1 Tax=Robiginitalea aestuariiviva TaxID=3036903 RepID=UPI00240DD948|nr:formyltransferase family protein [Robiginitalea aestuariiviva]MDG1572723.1 formyltransferase family protein [Robiginitalea aestuariiviva]